MQGKKFDVPKESRNKRNNRSDLSALPMIPDKRYFTISEVGYLCGVKPHVLRYWEQEFPQLAPVKRRGNRRYYQYQDVLQVREIRKLLYESGFTIEGARTQLTTGNSTEVSRSVEKDAVLTKLIADLETVLQKLKME